MLSLHHSVVSLLLLYTLTAQDRVVQPAGDVTATEGDTLTLGCTFQTSNQSPTLFWYKQKVNDFPKMLLLRFSTREDRPAEKKKKKERIDAIVNKTSVPLQIQKLQLSDSAVYYCALRPTVTGKHQTSVQKHNSILPIKNHSRSFLLTLLL
uniref:Ig-like domain-containing protein n=1 Tax=Scophthalmus maximus TaxID=52904 RepID=A0A8D3CWM2_SCOMX